MGDTNNDTRTFIQKKADAFWLLKTKVHISLRNGNWKRGIIEEVRAEFFILNESLEGRMPVFFTEIQTIEAYKPKEIDYGN